jgi:ABC-type polar amino acid transport system ATPase subunit
MNRDIILADEITAALDSDSRDKVIAVLRELRLRCWRSLTTRYSGLRFRLNSVWKTKL